MQFQLKWQPYIEDVSIKLSSTKKKKKIIKQKRAARKVISRFLLFCIFAFNTLPTPTPAAMYAAPSLVTVVAVILLPLCSIWRTSANATNTIALYVYEHLYDYLYDRLYVGGYGRCARMRKAGRMGEGAHNFYLLLLNLGLLYTHFVVAVVVRAILGGKLRQLV